MPSMHSQTPPPIGAFPASTASPSLQPLHHTRPEAWTGCRLHAVLDAMTFAGLRRCWGAHHRAAPSSPSPGLGEGGLQLGSAPWTARTVRAPCAPRTPEHGRWRTLLRHGVSLLGFGRKLATSAWRADTHLAMALLGRTRGGFHQVRVAEARASERMSDTPVACPSESSKALEFTWKTRGTLSVPLRSGAKQKVAGPHRPRRFRSFLFFGSRTFGADASRECPRHVRDVGWMGSARSVWSAGPRPDVH